MEQLHFDTIRADFDEIAGLPDEAVWNHNNCYFGEIISLLSPHCGRVLDIGCGKGELSAMAAKVCESVLAVDLSEKMIACATSRNVADNIEYRTANIMELPLENASLDAIITTATVHHLPFDWTLSFARDKLKPGGKLIILDLAQSSTVSDRLLWSFAVLPNLFMNLIKNHGFPAQDEHSKALWDKHGAHDRYMTIPEIRRLAEQSLPGAVVRRKLFWRYLLIWQKP